MRVKIGHFAGCPRWQLASRIQVLLSNDRNAPKLRKGAKLDNLKPKVDGVKGKRGAPPPTPSP